MKLTVNTQGLLNAVSIAAQFQNNEGDYANTICISGEDNMIEVKASNNRQAVHMKGLPFNAYVLTEDSFSGVSIESKKLISMLKATKSIDTVIDFEKSGVEVKCGRSKAKIALQENVQTFSEHTGEKTLQIDSDLIGHFEKALHSIDRDNPKYELNGLNLVIKDKKLSIASTDTRRLTISQSSVEYDDMDIIVPKEAVSSITKLFNGCSVSASISENFLVINTETISFTTNLISGSFPDWKRIVPSDVKHKITIGRTFLQDIIKDATLFESDIALIFTEETLHIHDLEKTLYVQEDFVTGIEETFFVGVNGKYLLDFLGSCGDETVEFHYAAENLPFLLKAGDYQEVIMPINSIEVDIPSKQDEQEAPNVELVA